MNSSSQNIIIYNNVNDKTSISFLFKNGIVLINQNTNTKIQLFGISE